MIASHQHDIAGGVVRGECPSFAPALGDSRPELLSSHQKVSGVESLVVVLVHAQVCSPLPHDSPASPRPIGPPTVDSPSCRAVARTFSKAVSALGAIRTPNLLIRSGLDVVAPCGNVSHSVAA